MRLSDLTLPTSATKHAVEILAQLADVELPRAAGYYVLAAQYKRPEKTAGGIILSHHVHDEDKYQGRTGLVISIGPDAYKGGRFESQWCQVGDWIAWPQAANAAYRMEYNSVTITALPDDQVVLVGVDPTLVS